MLVFCVEVAVTVTVVVVVTVGAVRTPEEPMVPAVEVHVTPVLKLPVPLTVAVHVLFCPEETVEGTQLTATEVTVDAEEPPLPPHAAIQITFTSTNKSPSLRTVSSSNL
jgi:hypothetical protein